MELKIQKQIGKRIYEFTVEGETLFEVLMQAEKLSFNHVFACGKCKSDKLRLRAYITDKDKYEYAKVECIECRSSVTFGKKKNDPSVYFLRKNDAGQLDWQESPKQQEAPKTFNPDDETIPF